MTHVLLADDDEQLRSIIGIALLKEGYDVSAVGDGRQAVERCRHNGLDLVVLDVMLPGLDGFEVCRQVRQFSDVPVLMLSVRRTEDDKVRALELGADDYLTKPFGHRELLARLRALLRRPKTHVTPPEPYSIGHVALNAQARTAVVDGRAVSLTPTEFRLLSFLVENAGQIFGPEVLLRQVHSYSYTRQEAQEIVKVHIRRLRQKIERDPDRPECLLNVRGAGYTFQTREGSSPEPATSGDHARGCA